MGCRFEAVVGTPSRRILLISPSLGDLYNPYSLPSDPVVRGADYDWGAATRDPIPSRNSSQILPKPFVWARESQTICLSYCLSFKNPVVVTPYGACGR